MSSKFDTRLDEYYSSINENDGWDGYWTIELFDPKTKENIEVELEFEWEVDGSDEIAITDATINDNFNFGGKKYRKGKSFPKELVVFTDAAEKNKRAKLDDFYEYVEQEVMDQYAHTSW